MEKNENQVRHPFEIGGKPKEVKNVKKFTKKWGIKKYYFEIYEPGKDKWEYVAAAAAMFTPAERAILDQLIVKNK